jgi:hypothetical protein
VLDHPALDPDTAARLDELVELFRTADALAFAGEGATEAPEFAAALDDLAAALAADVEQTSDPALCAVDDDVAPDGDAGRSYGRCVAAVRLDAALAQVAATGSEADVGVAVGAGVGLRQWYDRPPPEIVELVALTDALVDLPADRRPEAAEEAQLRLAPQWSGPESRCAEEFVEP